MTSLNSAITAIILYARKSGNKHVIFMDVGVKLAQAKLFCYTFVDLFMFSMTL